ncbi:hypothetical protein MTO96_005218 [Rhipicephalus appendiculatus]
MTKSRGTSRYFGSRIRKDRKKQLFREHSRITKKKEGRVISSELPTPGSRRQKKIPPNPKYRRGIQMKTFRTVRAPQGNESRIRCPLARQRSRPWILSYRTPRPFPAFVFIISSGARGGAGQFCGSNPSKCARGQRRSNWVCAASGGGGGYPELGRCKRG